MDFIDKSLESTVKLIIYIYMIYLEGTFPYLIINFKGELLFGSMSLKHLAVY